MRELDTLYTNRIKSDKVARWCERIINGLQRLDIKRCYLPGLLNILADAGSRIAMPERPDKSDDKPPPELRELIRGLFGEQDFAYSLVPPAKLGAVNIKKLPRQKLESLVADAITANFIDPDTLIDTQRGALRDERANTATLNSVNLALRELDVSAVAAASNESLAALGPETEVTFELRRVCTRRGDSAVATARTPLRIFRGRDGSMTNALERWITFRKPRPRRAADPAGQVFAFFKNGQYTEDVDQANEASYEEHARNAEELALKALRRAVNSEPSHGEWWILSNLSWRAKPTITVRGWKRNYAIGPIGDLAPQPH